jgi:hypothetical protein
LDLLGLRHRGGTGPEEEGEEGGEGEEEGAKEGEKEGEENMY